MTDKPLNISIHSDFRLNYLKAGEHTLIIPLPQEIATLIGTIIILWGAFELRMDAVIESIHASLKKEPPKGWRQLYFKQRKRLFKDVATEYTQQMFKGETEALQKIADSAGDIGWRRNIVAHGYISISAKPNTSAPTGADAVYFATGTHNGNPVAISLWNRIPAHQVRDVQAKPFASSGAIGEHNGRLRLLRP